MRKPAVLPIALLAVTALAAAAESDIHIPFEKYKLQNGMRVVLSRDTAVPVVALYVIYDVGARSEEKGRTGFAHLFEHMMFEGSANVKKGEHFKYVQANGGTMNGSTHPDYTDYFETMPSNKLGLALVAGIGPHAQSRDHTGESEKSAGGGETGKAAELRQPGLQHGDHRKVARAGVRQFSELAFADRIVRGSGGRRAWTTLRSFSGPTMRPTTRCW